MKICPICHRTYEDDVQYCEDDGAVLKEEKTPEAQENIQPAPTPPQQSTLVKDQIRKTVRKCPSCGWEGETDDQFCPECGARLVESQEVTGGKIKIEEKLIISGFNEIKIDNYPFHFGRALISNIPGSETVSREHFVITMTEKDGNRIYEIEDSGSLNGTSLNGKVIGYDRKSQGKFPLHDGDKISLCIDPLTGIGQFELIFKVIKNENSGS